VRGLSSFPLAIAICALAIPAAAWAHERVAQETRRYRAEEAHQGVAVGPDLFYAIDNNRIAAYDRNTGEKRAEWAGDDRVFQHLNSCEVDGDELVCAHSNYPRVPMASSLEWFDAKTLKHLRSRSLGPGIGSITWFTRHEGSWWAGFANYDGRGGEADRGHRFTVMVQYDDDFVRQQSWLFPDTVLERFAPYSTSGGVWGDDGLLYVTGHDREELYVLSRPPAGSTLNHLATVGISTGGQAISWDRSRERMVWSIDRRSDEVVVSEVPTVADR